MSDDVHVGEDGWLFLTGGQNAPLRMYRRNLANTWRLRRWAWLIALRARRCAALGIHYLHLPVPEKLSVYADKAPALGIDPTLGYGQMVSRMLVERRICIDTVPALIAGRAEAEMFLRTDSHWTTSGCRIAHDAVCAAFGVEPRWRLEDRLLVTVEGFTGDLGQKLTPQPSESLLRHISHHDAKRIEANGLVLHHEDAGTAAELHRGASAIYRNAAPDADPRRLVLFGDSYANFAHHGLTAMLAETFCEVHFTWSAAIDWGYVERTRPDLVLTQIAERFMTKLPPDRGFDNTAFAERKLRALDRPA